MKLFTKYNRVSIIASILALLLGSLGYYFTVRYVLIHQLDNALRIEEDEIHTFVRLHGRLPEPANYRDQQVRFDLASTPVKRRFIHTTLTNRHHDDDEPYRELIFPVSVGTQYYTASVAMSAEETEDLLVLITCITAAMILLLLGTLFLANRLLLRRIWQPFYRTLDNIRHFNLSSRQPLPSPQQAAVEEFRDLDEATRQMTQKVLRDYDTLKAFTGNASHEMQTPLAIINSKLDLIIQDPDLEERHLRTIQAIYDAVGRLRQLHQSLLLLTRIENNQFDYTQPVDMAPLIQDKLVQLDLLIRDRRLTVSTHLDPVPLSMNNYLADILLNNILVNAIRHNQDGGSLDIRLQTGLLQVSNTGPVLPFDPATIFDRFTKSPHSPGSGLGGAIVRQICDNYHFALSYSYQAGRHQIDIRFP